MCAHEYIYCITAHPHTNGFLVKSCVFVAPLLHKALLQQLKDTWRISS